MKYLLVYGAVLVLGVAYGQASTTQATVTAQSNLREVMRGVCRDQILMLQRRDTRLRYRVQRVDRKGATLRDQIESRDGGVARLLQHDSRMLTPEENQGERERLSAMLGTNRLQQREREEARSRAYGVELLQAMPDAMHFAIAPEQAPLGDVSDRQLVIDFEPDPAFHPASLAQQILPALHGRLWLDLEDNHLLRMELRNTGEVSLAWGLLAKVYPGGSVVYEQRRFQGIYTFTRITLHLRLRELMVKTVAMDADTAAEGFQRLSSSLSGDDAIRLLLAEHVPTR